MIIWLIVSVPFWLSGAVFLITALLWASDLNHPDAIAYGIVCLLFCGGLWYIAAKLCS